MTRKNFNAFALALAEVRPDDPAARKGWRVSVIAVSDVCKASNRAFDRERFMDACLTWIAVIRDGVLVKA